LVEHAFGKTTGPPTWNDLASVDCVLCLRVDPWHRGFERKPATKLINTWVAGAIAVIGDEPAYREVAVPGQDSLMVDRPEEVPRALGRLRADPDLIARLEAGGLAQAERFAPERVLDQWERLLFDRTAAPSSLRGRLALAGSRLAATVAVPAMAADEALRRSVSRRLPGRQV
jgi:hypothetical protein